MVNPLYGYISVEGKLFQEVDGIGIDTYKNQSFLLKTFDCIFGKALQVSYAGDTITVDKRSAERFFSRNDDLFYEGGEALTLCQKILLLLEKRRKLPEGLFPEKAVGGEEAKKSLIGARRHFAFLAKALQKNAFEVECLLELLRKKREKIVLVERDELFSHIIEENKLRIDQLQSSIGDDRVKALADYLIQRIRQELSKK